MNSIGYTENTTKKTSSGKLAKAAILLFISLTLFWFMLDYRPFLPFGPESAGWRLWFSYANDLILPFALYFLICLGERWLKTWQSRALLAFIVPTLLECRQALYHPINRYVGAFDPVDIVVYAIGVGLAVLIEQKVFAKLLKFW